jgi:hypothetical protein
MKKIKCSHKETHQAYSVQGSKMPFKNGVTEWSLMNFSKDLPKHEQILIFKDVFCEFQSHMPFLKFKSIKSLSHENMGSIKAYFVNKNGDINLKNGVLRCPFKFDKETIAVGYFPNSEERGHIYIDDTKFFTLKNEKQGYKLKQVLKHEIGHILGLRHSANPEDLMYPKYSPIADFTKDSISGLIHIYEDDIKKSFKRSINAQVLLETVLEDKVLKKRNFFKRIFCR